MHYFGALQIAQEMRSKIFASTLKCDSNEILRPLDFTFGDEYFFYVGARMQQQVVTTGEEQHQPWRRPQIERSTIYCIDLRAIDRPSLQIAALLDGNFNIVRAKSSRYSGVLYCLRQFDAALAGTADESTAAGEKLAFSFLTIDVEHPYKIIDYKITGRSIVQ